jgi:hypothetical protein
MFRGLAADVSFTDVTLGVRSTVPIPVTFRGVSYHREILVVQAYADQIQRF